MKPNFFPLPGLDPGIHVSVPLEEDVDGRIKSGHGE
jgi:hypothetical protein